MTPIEQAAERLAEATARHAPTAPVRHLISDPVEAYAAQQVNVAAAVAEGRRIVGRKIGLTSPVVQRQLGVDQPDFGALFADMCLADGVPLPMDRLLQPRIEAEVALVLGTGLDRTENTVASIISATAFALPALEVVDSRIADWDITLVDTIADNASSAMFVLGSQPVELSAVDVRAVEMSMSINGSEVSTGTGADCLYNPLHAAVWLADTLAALGTPLVAGDIVLTGALGPMAAIEPGDSIIAELIGLGSVSTRCPPTNRKV